MKDQTLYELLQMVPVQPGTFLMGSPEGEGKIENDERQVEVKLTRHFELGRFLVTDLVWELVMGKSLDGDPYLPKSSISWFDAVEFCSKLNELLGLPQAMVKVQKGWHLNPSSPGFRLPTEAEWEYACRAGTTEDRYGFIDDIAWYYNNSGSKVQPIGLKLPNSWGFHDTLGNVLEWCWDWHSEIRINEAYPEGPLKGALRVLRGGSSRFAAFNIRAAKRYPENPKRCHDDFGFRLARTLPRK